MQGCCPPAFLVVSGQPIMKNNAAIGAIAGSVAGLGYFYTQESGIPKSSNAQYLAPISTDILAWIFGGVVMYKGFQKNDGTLTFIGSSIVSIHLSQFAAHKVLNRE